MLGGVKGKEQLSQHGRAVLPVAVSTAGLGWYFSCQGREVSEVGWPMHPCAL